MMKTPLVAAAVATMTSVALWAQVPAPQQARDAQGQTQVALTAAIIGTVVTGAGQPADGVRLTLSGNELRGSRSVLTDDNGKFAILGLPPGTFTLRASKTGYVSATYGQKAPGRSGTPIVLVEGQQLKDVSIEVPKGGVISGVIYDEKNRPSISTSVRVMMWTMQSGERILVSSASATTDDRGVYRAFGLTPGDYLVQAVGRNTSNVVITTEDLRNIEQMQVLEKMAATGSVNINVNLSELARDIAVPAAANEPVSGYAPVYFPGTTQVGQARAVKVGVSEEHLGVDFQLQRVSLSKVTGQVIAPANITLTNVQLRLFDRSSAAEGAQQLTARAGRDGTFSFMNVPPGQYQITASVPVPATLPANASSPVEQRPTSGADRLWAQGEVQVDGGYSPNVTLALQSGMTITGGVSFEGTTPQPPLKNIRMTLSPHGRAMSSAGLSTVTVTADANGRFTFTGVTPGQYRIRPTGVNGWTAKSVMADGRDALDYWVEVKPAENITNVMVTFGDKFTDLKGTLQTAGGQPTADYTVIIFPADNRYWVPLARRMRSVRPSTDGKFSFGGLPPGDYRLAAVTDVEAGAWYDPDFLRELQSASVAVRLVDGQPVVQDLRVSGQ